MELRLLKTDVERGRFRANMAKARETRGGKFRETATSRVSEIQLSFARLYAIADSDDTSSLLGGFSIHCLNEFSQSFPLPNLSHLAPSTVYEAGQLWAFSHEAGQALRKAAQALLIYPLIIPRDVSSLYRVFKRVSPPFEVPFAETVRGEKVYLQAMLLEGDDLRHEVQRASCDGFETRETHGLIRFEISKMNVNSLSAGSRLRLVMNGSEEPTGSRNATMVTAES
jgi:hypothetical protein